MIRDLKTEIEAVVNPVVTQEGFDLIEMKLARYKKKYRLRIYVDSDSGVTLDNCAHLSRLVGTAIDLTDLLSDGYILEISSPGIDRPLHSDNDFRRKIGRSVRIDLIDNKQSKTARGTLTRVEEGNLVLSSENGVIEIALENVRQGKEII